MTEHVIDRLDAYLDNELDPGERRSVDAHLRACDDCARALVEGRRLRALLIEATPRLDDLETERFWRALAPQLPPRRRGLGPGWAWGGMMLVGGLLAQVVPAIALALSLASLGGYPVARLVPGRLLGWSESVAVTLSPLVDAASAALTDAEGSMDLASGLGGGLEGLLNGGWMTWLPSVVFTTLAAATALAFMGWAVAALRARPATPVPTS